MSEESDSWKAWRLREIAERRRFYTMKTMLGGEPDINRRFIADLARPKVDHIETWNFEMKPWTAEDEQRLRTRLDELNRSYER